MTKVDPATSLSRGYLVLSSDGRGPYTFCRVKVSVDGWQGLVSFFRKDLIERYKDQHLHEKEMQQDTDRMIKDFVRLAITALLIKFPNGLDQVFALGPQIHAETTNPSPSPFESLREAIHSTTLYRVIEENLRDPQWIEAVLKETHFLADTTSLKEDPLLSLLVVLCLLVVMCIASEVEEAQTLKSILYDEDLREKDLLKAEVDFLYSRVKALGGYCCKI